ncbi:endonuclease/exonuclease/phosphatase family protein [Virgibacillus sp. L01]
MYKPQLLTWNIRQGGKREIKKIVASLVRYDADLIVLTEFRENAAEQFLRQEMQANGWHYTISSDPRFCHGFHLKIIQLPMVLNKAVTGGRRFTYPVLTYIF